DVDARRGRCPLAVGRRREPQVLGAGNWNGIFGIRGLDRRDGGDVTEVDDFRLVHEDEADRHGGRCSELPSERAGDRDEHWVWRGAKQTTWPPPTIGGERPSVKSQNCWVGFCKLLTWLVLLVRQVTTVGFDHGQRYTVRKQRQRNRPQGRPDG